ncbi:MAG: hypothetical protein OXE85_12135 [Roseovarius sp.]|nr:hypothetical protein [Roseovarius sp.]MCY4316678.1 hypothetical protein [Roseovarius sp.]
MKFGTLMLFTLLVAANTSTALPELAGRIESKQPASCAEYRFFGTSIYRAELWTDAVSMPGDAFALSLVYRRGFKRGTLVASSISEMARISGRARSEFNAAKRELEQAFRTIEKGDRFTAWRGVPDRIEFFKNGIRTGALTHDADLFLDIWLGAESRNRKHRARLLSGRCDD